MNGFKGLNIPVLTEADLYKIQGKPIEVKTGTGKQKQQSKPAVSEPEPVVPEPEPIVSEPEPEPVVPEPEPEPIVSEPEPDPEPVVSDPDPESKKPTSKNRKKSHK